jgi:hypothetical protein
MSHLPRRASTPHIAALIAAHPLDEAASRVKYGTTMWLYEFV